MQELEATWGRASRIWWLFMWRGILGATLIGGAVGFVFGIIVAVFGLPQQALAIGSPILGAAVGLLWSLLVVRMALRKRYSGFRIVLVPR